MRFENNACIETAFDGSINVVMWILSLIHSDDFFATRFEDFSCVKTSLLEWLVVTLTRRDLLAAVAFGKNRRRVKAHSHWHRSRVT